MAISKRMRLLGSIAILTAYKLLIPSSNKVPEYLRRLFSLKGPFNDNFLIATLNHDLAIEQLADTSGTALFDGFGEETQKERTFLTQFEIGYPEDIKELGNKLRSFAIPYLGFEDHGSNKGILLKLHGSLGWFDVEEGSGHFGYIEELRFNVSHGFFRLPHSQLFEDNLKKNLAFVPKSQNLELLRLISKNSIPDHIGRVWIRPYLGFARSFKVHLDTLSLEMLAMFSKAIDRGRTFWWLDILGRTLT